MIDAEVALRGELPLVVTVAEIVADDPVTKVVKKVTVVLFVLRTAVVPVGNVQVTYWLGIVIPLEVTTVAVSCPPVLTVWVDRLIVILLIVPEMTSIGTAELFVPPQLTVTVA